MGVGTPINLLEAIERGVDMFDCVMPTRNGRNGMLFTSEGVINIRNRKWRMVWNRLDKGTAGLHSCCHEGLYISCDIGGVWRSVWNNNYHGMPECVF